MAYLRVGVGCGGIRGGDPRRKSSYHRRKKESYVSYLVFLYTAFT